MKNKSKLIILTFLAIGTTCSGFATNGQKCEYKTDYTASVPGMGLILDEVKFDGISIKNFHFENNKKCISVKTGEKFDAYFQYKLDSSKLKTMHLKHLIIGLHDDGPQKCVLDTLGFKDSKGKEKVTLVAPEKTGIYQVRFCFSEGITKEDAMKDWWHGDGPSSKTIVGIVVVK